MKTHELKTWPKFFRPLTNFSKKFEVRKNDRDFKTGDVLVLKEWDPTTEKYSDRYVIAEVTFIMYSNSVLGQGIGDGYCVMSLDILTAHP